MAGPETYTPDNADQKDQLVRLRRHLHTLAEPSGQEHATAACLARHLRRPTVQLVTDLGGHGLVAIMDGQEPTTGPAIMLRAELDAVPVSEYTDPPWHSITPGYAHKCGHDGHMTILLGLADRLTETPFTCGRVILLFQPAEETGQGAAALLDDNRFAALQPDWIFALHNLPGYEVGRVLLRDGAFCAGSAGLRIQLSGQSAHAAYPQQGLSPEGAITELVPALTTLPIAFEAHDQLTLVTVVHMRLGQPDFGVAPGDAEILATLRAADNQVLADLKAAAVTLVHESARTHGLDVEIKWQDEFPVTWNDPGAVAEATKAARTLGLAMELPEESPFRWSEDFGHLAALGQSALIGLGSGLNHPVLHSPDYDFNDDLLPVGVDLLETLVRRLLT